VDRIHLAEAGCTSSGSTKGGEFIEQPSEYWLLEKDKEDSTLWR
jgi:hypothetical protein